MKKRLSAASEISQVVERNQARKVRHFQKAEEQGATRALKDAHHQVDEFFKDGADAALNAVSASAGAVPLRLDQQPPVPATGWRRRCTRRRRRRARAAADDARGARQGVHGRRCSCASPRRRCRPRQLAAGAGLARAAGRRGCGAACSTRSGRPTATSRTRSSSSAGCSPSSPRSSPYVNVAWFLVGLFIVFGTRDEYQLLNYVATYRSFCFLFAGL